MTIQPKAIIIVGNPVDGFEFYGPFDSMDDAARHANNNDNMQDDSWYIVRLYHPLDDGPVA